MVNYAASFQRLSLSKTKRPSQGITLILRRWQISPNVLDLWVTLWRSFNPQNEQRSLLEESELRGSSWNSLCPWNLRQRIPSWEGLFEGLCGEGLSLTCNYCASYELPVTTNVVISLTTTKECFAKKVVQSLSLWCYLNVSCEGSTSAVYYVINFTVIFLNIHANIIARESSWRHLYIKNRINIQCAFIMHYFTEKTDLKQNSRVYRKKSQNHVRMYALVLALFEFKTLLGSFSPQPCIHGLNNLLFASALNECSIARWAACSVTHSSNVYSLWWHAVVERPILSARLTETSVGGSLMERKVAIKAHLHCLREINSI